MNGIFYFNTHLCSFLFHTKQIEKGYNNNTLFWLNRYLFANNVFFRSKFILNLLFRYNLQPVVTNEKANINKQKPLWKIE